MGLIQTIEEVKEHVAVNVSTDIKSIMPDLVSAEKPIRKALGKEQYQELLDAYQAETELPEKLQALLTLVQPALANLAYASYVTIGQLQIDDSGFRIISDSQNKTAFKWQIDDVKEYFFAKGYAAIDDLLAFLEENKADYPLWKESEAYTITKLHFVNSTAEFNDIYSISGSRRTFLALQPVMRKVEELCFETALSPEFFDELKEQIKTDSLSDDNKKLMRWLKPAVVNLTIARAIPELGLQLTEDALVIQEYITAEGKNKKSPSDNLLSLKIRKATEDGQTYLKRLMDYLNTTASETKYAAYFQSSNYQPTYSAASPEVRNSGGNIYGAF